MERVQSTGHQVGRGVYSTDVERGHTPRVDSYSFIATSPPDLGGFDPPPRKARLVIGGASWARAVTLPEAGEVVVECDAHGAQPACCSCPSLRGVAAELGTRMTRPCPLPEPAPRVTRPRKAGLRLPVCSKTGSTRHVPSDSPLGQNFLQKKRNPGFGISCASQCTISTPKIIASIPCNGADRTKFISWTGK